MAGKANIEAIYPLTPVQEGILFHTLYAPESPLYIQQYVCTLGPAARNGYNHASQVPFDVESWRKSWQLIIERHQALRSLLTWQNRDQALQIVRERVEPQWHYEDWRHVEDVDQGTALEAYLNEDRKRGFSLDEAPLVRFALFRTSDNTYQFVWTHHHIVIDGWSMGVVLGEVDAAYAALVSGEDLVLGEPAPYSSYIAWVQDQDFARAMPYWKQQLAGLTSATRMRIGRETASERWAEEQAQHVTTLDHSSTSRLSDFARTAGVTLSSVLRGAWSILLSRYSGETDVVFGATVAGRPNAISGATSMVGMFINSIPVRIHVDDEAPLMAWLSDIQRQQVEMSEYESTPLTDIQSWSDVPHGEPLFDSLLVVENVPGPNHAGSLLDYGDVEYRQRSNYPLAILALPGERLELIFLYDHRRYQAAEIQRLARQFGETLDSMTNRGDRCVGEVDVVPKSQLRRLVVDWNQTGTGFEGLHAAADQRIDQLILKTAATVPNRVAVSGFGGQGEQVNVTYADLAERAERIAKTLQDLGVTAGTCVGVAMDRSPAFLVAMLGVLRSGAAYVPLDPSQPESRIRYMLNDTRATVVILDVGSKSFSDRPHMAYVQLDHLGEVAQAVEPEQSDTAETRSRRAAPKPMPDDLAYVLYTSGSTGRPKGVMVAHRSLVNSTLARDLAYHQRVDTYLLLSPFVFDSSIAGIFWTLVQGGKLVLPRPRMEQDVRHVAELISRHQVTHTLALPTIYGLLLDHAPPGDLDSLRVVVVAGEACPPSLVETHFRYLPNAGLYNEYGPTEGTVWTTMHPIEPKEASSDRVPIGRPIANTQAFVLDHMLRPVPPGLPGELFIAGENLALGYVGAQDLTSKRFVTTELPMIGSLRLYATGDVARWREEGTLELLGRLDHQVKLRGQRIELEEIEMILKEHVDVTDAVVVVGNLESPAPYLVAHVETSADPDLLREHLVQHLPKTMVPRVILTTDGLPRGITGKVDRNALMGIEHRPENDRQFVAPSGEAERRLAAIWADVLDVEEVGTTDNFFELGGDSILSIRIIARANEAGLPITPKQFFDHPTIADQAHLTDG